MIATVYGLISAADMQPAFEPLLWQTFFANDTDLQLAMTIQLRCSAGNGRTYPAVIGITETGKVLVTTASEVFNPH